jgi:dTDP-glucose 4,6-dehydratase
MLTYLVTGGSGFIGSNFIHYMFNKYDNIKIINVDKLTYAGNLGNLKDFTCSNNYTFIKADICDKEPIAKIFAENDIDYVINFAAESHVDRSIIDPEIFMKTNILGTVNLLNIAKLSWETDYGFKQNKRFLQISTDEVYGSLDKFGYFTETSLLSPHSPYASSKASADLIVSSYYDTYKLPINITRCSNNYGPYQFPEKLIPLLINNCMNKLALPIYGDGLNIRDWIYVDDHCSAIDMVINSGELGEVYNIGASNEKTNLCITKTIVDYMFKYVDKEVNKSLITFVTDRKGHDRRYAIDASKIKETLGWQNKTTFKVGIEATIKWYLDNNQWLAELHPNE